MSQSSARKLTCPLCGDASVPLSARSTGATCPACGGSLAEATWRRKRLAGLQTSWYEHPVDRQALDALKRTAGFEVVVRKFHELGLDQFMKIECVGSNLRVTRRNYPELHSALEEVCRVLDLPEVPELYVEHEDRITAFTAGVEAPLVCITSGCVDFLSREELLFVLGREAGHIKSSHLLYSQIAAVLPHVGRLVGRFTLNIGEILSKGLESALMYWYRMSEYTADRAGLLACQDVTAASTALVKAAGLPQRYQGRIDLEEFRRQAQEFRSLNRSVVTRIVRVTGESGREHSWSVARMAELTAWLEGGAYESLLANPESPPGPPGSPQGASSGGAGGSGVAGAVGGTVRAVGGFVGGAVGGVVGGAVGGAKNAFGSIRSGRKGRKQDAPEAGGSGRVEEARAPDDEAV